MTAGDAPADPQALEALQALGAHAVPIEGGYSGETFLVGAAGEQAVLRLYGRHPERAAIDAALLELVRTLVPVPRVLDVRTPEMAARGPAHLLTELLPGRRLELVLPEADAALRRRLAENVADVLARLSGIPFRRTGEFADAALTVRRWPPLDDGLVAWVDRHLAGGPLAAWEGAEQRGLREVADHADALLAATDRYCLVHSDFNAKNVLVHPATGEVTGLVDWEFAHAGTPYSDLGNLLRFERDPAFTEPLLQRFRDRAPAVPDDRDHLVERARAADLWALVDLAARAEQHAVARRVHSLLRAIARGRDLHAQP